MATLAVVKADGKNYTRARTYTDYCILTMGYWNFKRFCGLVKIPIGYTHVQYKTVNIGNTRLVGFCWKRDATSPRSATFLNKFILRKGFYLWDNYFRFIQSVLNFEAADYFSSAGINAKLAVQYWLSSPFFEKQSQYFMMTFVFLSHVCESRSSWKRRCFWRSFWCKSLLKDIRSSRCLFFQICFGRKIVLP